MLSKQDENVTGCWEQVVGEGAGGDISLQFFSVFVLHPGHFLLIRSITCFASASHRARLAFSAFTR